jgi:hypothetical protein
MKNESPVSSDRCLTVSVIQRRRMIAAFKKIVSQKPKQERGNMDYSKLAAFQEAGVIGRAPYSDP